MTVNPDVQPEKESGAFSNTVRIIAASVGALFFGGGFGGVLAEMGKRPDGWTVQGMVMLAGFALLGLLCVAYVGLNWRRSNEVLAPSVRRTNAFGMASGALGAVIAITLLVGERQIGGGHQPSVLSNAPLPAWTAWVLIAIILTVIPWVTWKWHRSADEHESESYRDGALMGIYAYSAISVCWWLGWRGGFLTAPDAMAIFFATYVVWAGVWLWRRYR